MYCNITKTTNKKASVQCGKNFRLRTGYPKQLEVTETITDKGIRYGWKPSQERFERDRMESYLIRFRHSKRVGGGKFQVESHQVARTNFYDLVEIDLEAIMDIGDEAIKAIGLPIHEYKQKMKDKVQPLIDQVREEFSATEEYKAMQEQKAMIKSYQERKAQFEATYGKDTYDYCYDLTGALRSPEYLQSLIRLVA